MEVRYAKEAVEIARGFHSRRFVCLLAFVGDSGEQDSAGSVDASKERPKLNYQDSVVE